VSVAWQFYISTVLIYLGVDVIACWGLNLQFGVAGLVNFAFIIFQAAGAYTAAVLTLGPATKGGFQQYVGGAHWPFPLPILAAGLVGAALFYGDGVITPAISVLSAVEGLKMATPLFEPYIVPSRSSC